MHRRRRGSSVAATVRAGNGASTRVEGWARGARRPGGRGRRPRPPRISCRPAVGAAPFGRAPVDAWRATVRARPRGARRRAPGPRHGCVGAPGRTRRPGVGATSRADPASSSQRARVGPCARDRGGADRPDTRLGEHHRGDVAEAPGVGVRAPPAARARLHSTSARRNPVPRPSRPAARRGDHGAVRVVRVRDHRRPSGPGSVAPRSRRDAGATTRPEPSPRSRTDRTDGMTPRRRPSRSPAHRPVAGLFTPMTPTAPGTDDPGPHGSGAGPRRDTRVHGVHAAGTRQRAGRWGSTRHGPARRPARAARSVGFAHPVVDPLS